MPKKKQKGTLDVVRGLIEAADEVKFPQGTRIPSQCVGGHLPQDPKTRKEMGKYVGRVVLMSLAAELALKFAWENEPVEGRTGAVPSGANGHDLDYLFRKICCLRDEVKEGYVNLLGQNEEAHDGWETADRVFEKSKDAFELYRYIVEQGREAGEPMHATELGIATLSVIKAIEGLEHPDQC